MQQDGGIDQQNPLTLNDAEVDALYAQLLREYTAAVQEASGLANAVDVIQNHPALAIMKSITAAKEQNESAESIKLKVETLRRRIENNQNPTTAIYEIIHLLSVLKDKLDIDVRVEIMEILETFKPEDQNYINAKLDLYRALAGDFTPRPVDTSISGEEA